jgi:hypothetical protein
MPRPVFKSTRFSNLNAGRPQSSFAAVTCSGIATPERLLQIDSIEQDVNPRDTKTRRPPNGCDQDHHTQENEGSRSIRSTHAELLQTDINSSKKQEGKYLPKERPQIGPTLVQL